VTAIVGWIDFDPATFDWPTWRVRRRPFDWAIDAPELAGSVFVAPRAVLNRSAGIRFGV
jgi:hypothetical protein